MTHLTYVHYMILGLFIFLFVLLSVFAFLKSKHFLALSLTSFLSFSMLGFFSIFVVDSYTKKAKILSLDQRRMLMNETISFTGRIKNTGDFTIGKCIYEIKLVDRVNKKINRDNIFTPKAGLDIKTRKRPNKISKTFIIAKNLKPNETRNFTVNMPYPPYFEGTRTYQKLKCR